MANWLGEDEIKRSPGFKALPPVIFSFSLFPFFLSSFLSSFLPSFSFSSSPLIFLPQLPSQIQEKDVNNTSLTLRFFLFFLFLFFSKTQKLKKNPKQTKNQTKNQTKPKNKNKKQSHKFSPLGKHHRKCNR